MKSEIPGNPEFDDAMRGLHDTSVGRVSPTTLARLRTARHSPAAGRFASRLGRGWPWLGSSLASLLLLVAVGMQLIPEAGPEPTEAPVPWAAADTVAELESVYPSALAALDEDPDLYVWLASESQPMTLEQR